ncbi:hypothetical protein WMY93_008564 [Mugilogobius chulae]|uniref:Uncharacterized protein n=1 Tax=Mugilogobius chulae TaxID=88201 RepID=A0AAW0PGA8_9GOBI
MVFLFVLYLNRNGMKKWIIEMRDACRDVLEGYHYRYEIDTDPRRTSGSISAESGNTRAPGQFGLSQQLPNDTCIDQMPTDTQITKAQRLKTQPDVITLTCGWVSEQGLAVATGKSQTLGHFTVGGRE